MAPRRQFDLLPEDQQFLNEFGLKWETIVDGSPWVLLHQFPAGDRYDHSQPIAAIRIETGYPSSQLDMVYFFPRLKRRDGKAIGATQSTQVIDGKTFQRWSRHRTAQNPWKVGEDHLGTHVHLVEDWLDREFRK